MAGQGKQTSAERRKQKAAEARVKAQAASRKRRLQVIGGTLAVALVAGGAFAGVAALTGDDDNDSATQEPNASATPTPEPTVDQAGVPEGKKRCAYPDDSSPTGDKAPGKPEELADATGTVVATIATSGGAMKFELNRAAAPCTVNSFVNLAQKGFYEKTTCHRLLDTTGTFVLQCGDPQNKDVTEKGNGGPGYSFADENLTGATYDKGVVAMANSGPNTNGSQFFIMFKDSQFSPDYVPFGKVVDGLDVVEKTAAAGTEARPNPPGVPSFQEAAKDVPKKPLTLQKITVAESKAKPSTSPKPSSTQSPKA